MTNKKVYQVWGSDDATLGIYTTKKQAYARALDYVLQTGNLPVIPREGNIVGCDEAVEASYSLACKRLSDSGYASIKSGRTNGYETYILYSDPEASIETFYLNN